MIDGGNVWFVKKTLDRCKRKPEDHICGEWQCEACKRFVTGPHLCYIRSRECKEKKPRYIFFDFECIQEDLLHCKDGYSMKRNDECVQCSNSPEPCMECCKCVNCHQSWCGKSQHKPNLVVAQTVCEECFGQELTPNSKCDNCGTRCKKCNKKNKQTFINPPCKNTCGFREIVFRGDQTANAFGLWLFTETHKDFTAIAHNMKGYDGYFLLEYLLVNSIIPKIIYAGSKIMYLHVQRGLNIKILDSLNFLPMRLAELPKAFGLRELKKGYFPHFFNTKENAYYVGSYPAAHFYGSDMMNAKERKDFLIWHQEKLEKNMIFDFDREILDYCRSDVDILRQACLKFREILMKITGKEEVVFEDEMPEKKLMGGVDPFQCTTIAGVCMEVFKSKFLQEEWRVKVRGNDGISDWLQARRLQGDFSILFKEHWVTGEELQNQEYVIEESEFVSSPISQIPSTGYAPFLGQYSCVSIQWLSWIQEDHFKKTGHRLYIQHALNEGEFRLPGTNYLLDGYCPETNTAYEFHGCYWHGCPICFPTQRQQLKHIRTKHSMNELLTMTLKKRDYIQSLGMKYVYIWEHDFENLLKQNQGASDYVHSLNLQERLDPRKSFFGGRTNAVKMYYQVKEGEKIHYLDFCSLYPSVNKYGRYPVKEPKIITSNFTEITDYFGLAKVKILPPRQLYHPVLPQKINGKLTFALCRTCSEQQQQNPCQCRDEDRAITGVFCTPEIEKAIECGYQILQIYEVYHWDETSQYNAETESNGLFGEYINLFLKIKQEASGWPEWVHTEEDAVKYMEEYALREGIQLERENITKNPALRSIAKLLLNSFWGKFGQRLNMQQTTFFHEREADKFFQLLSDPSKEVSNFHIVSKEIIQVSWQQKENFTKEDYQTNVFIATFTTCWARLKLYEVLQMLDRRVLYFDTDSVIFVSRPGDQEPKVGSFLGQLTSELQPKEYITEFVSGGPKNYAYRTSEGKEVCKIKGFTLNYVNSLKLNFASMLDLVLRPDQGQHSDSTGSCTTIVNPHRIMRHKQQQIIYNRNEEKKYKIVYDKRVIQRNTWDTLPYGY